MTTTIPAHLRKRKPKRQLSGRPGTLWALAQRYASGYTYSSTYLSYLRAAICDLGEVIGREPRLKDLNARNMTALRAALAAKPDFHTRMSRLRVFWAWLAEQRLVKPAPPEFQALGPGNRGGNVQCRGADGLKVALSTEQGTLWHVCVTLYFPRNLDVSSERTKCHYKIACKWFKIFLGRDPLLSDLTDDNLTALLKFWHYDRGRAPETANNCVGRLRALWSWLAKRRIVEAFPTYCNLKEPKRCPRAWTRDQLDQLVNTCQTLKGLVGSVPAADWWKGLVLVCFDTAERIGAVLSIRKTWIDWDSGDLIIPAEFRKGGDADKAHWLHPDTRDVLRRISEKTEGELLFAGMKLDRIYWKFKKIRKDAGLATDRKSAFHRIRKSVASHLHAAGYNATDALGHASADITRKAYLDPAIAGGVRPAQVLFRPGMTAEEPAPVILLDELPADEIRRLPRAKAITA